MATNEAADIDRVVRAECGYLLRLATRQGLAPGEALLVTRAAFLKLMDEPRSELIFASPSIARTVLGAFVRRLARANTTEEVYAGERWRSRVDVARVDGALAREAAAARRLANDAVELEGLLPPGARKPVRAALVTALLVEAVASEHDERTLAGTSANTTAILVRQTRHDLAALLRRCIVAKA